MSTYTQLTREQRYQISALLKVGLSQRVIADNIGVHKSTISRELKRNRGLRGYRPRQAHLLAQRRQEGKVKRRLLADHWQRIEALIEEDWSPEQISLWLKEEDHFHVSPEWIYQHILKDKCQGGELYRHLRCRKQRKKRYGSYERRGQIPNKVSIEQRPAIVETRQRIGDWELDTIIGKGHRQAIVSLTERKSRLTRIAKVESKCAEGVTRTVIALLKPLMEDVHTLTSDNGKEFAQHDTIAKALRAEYYFAHPYASWERGLNENTNGLIRQYFPKNCDFTQITDEQIQTAMEKLNNRPRKCLGMKTPNQVFFGIDPPVALAS